MPFFPEIADTEDFGQQTAGSMPTKLKVAVFGHFGSGNLGNEATLQAMLDDIHRINSESVVLCICTGPETVQTDYRVEAVQVSGLIVSHSPNRLAAWARRLVAALPREGYRWFKAYRAMKGADVLIVAGTGLLTDAYSLFGWGPYNLLKWCTVAKIRRCKILFVSVGVGPVYSFLGKLLLRLSLSTADFRSYRDESTMGWVKRIGFHAVGDEVRPDLVFSLRNTTRAGGRPQTPPRPVLGLGLMQDAGRYSTDRPTGPIQSAYLQTLVTFVQWVLAQGWDIRLLIGDVVDVPVIEEFRTLLKGKGVDSEGVRVAFECPTSVPQLLNQIQSTDAVVATRFHNVLMAFLLGKPAIAISFHHKCSSLMEQMQMSKYCRRIDQLDAEDLIATFRELEANAETIKQAIRQAVEDKRAALSEQYNHMQECLGSAKPGPRPKSQTAIAMAEKGE